jgi:hypothetical protein
MIRMLKARGALNEADAGESLPQGTDVATRRIPQHLLDLLPASVARENCVLPLEFDGETLTCAAADANDIARADKLRFILNKDILFVPAPREAILQAIERNYGPAKAESVDSMLHELTDTAIDFSESEYELDEDADFECEEADLALAEAPPPPPRAKGGMGRYLGKGIVEFKKGLKGKEPFAAGRWLPGQDLTQPIGGASMFFYTVEEGQQVLVARPDGTLEVVAGPRRVWRWRKTFRAMAHHVAHPEQFLVVRYRDGRQENIPGPAHLWLDPRIHLQITTQEALQIAAKEAVVVYTRATGSSGITAEPGSTAIARRIVHGPALFVPQPGEWLHTFSWHASRGGSRGVQKVPNALVFQKLWLMPDQMYHDVADVRTADDAVLTIRLMIFFELLNIERMLETTHDPIGDFVNAATSDVVEHTGKHTFEAFKRSTERLNELETYRQLTGRAAQCGYRINKVVYRGYGTADALQQMHDHAIEARTKLQLDRATEEQSQDLENYKLDSQLARAGKRRSEQSVEVEHDLGLAAKRQAQELRQREALQAAAREMRRLEGELQLEQRRRQDAEQREHLASLKELGVDLTAYLTQARADRVIEVRGGRQTHVHLEPQTSNGPAKDRAGERPA